MRLGRVGTWLATVAVGGAMLAACGSSKQTVSTGPLANAYQATQAAHSAKVKLTLSVQLANSSQGLTVSGSGAYGWSPLRGTFSLQVNTGGQRVTLPERLVGTLEYIKFPAPVAQFGNKSWLGLNLTQFFNAASSTSFDPTQELALLEGQATVTNAGRQTVDGVSATKYTATVNPAKAVRGVTPQVHQLLQRLQAAGLKSIPVQVWLDGAGRPVRMTLSERLDKAPAGSPATQSSLFPETSVITMDFSGWGTPVTVSPPPASDVYQVSAQQLQDLGL